MPVVGGVGGVFNPLSAKNAQVRIGSFVYIGKRWEVRPRTDALDITNFEGGGFADWIGGITECEFTVEADWDSTGDLFANPPNIVPGAILTGVILYTNLVGSPAWTFPFALVTETPMNAPVRELISVTFTAKAKGTFSTP